MMSQGILKYATYQPHNTFSISVQYGMLPPAFHPHNHPLTIPTHPWKGQGTRDTPHVNRQTPVKTLPPHNFVGGR